MRVFAGSDQSVSWLASSNTTLGVLGITVFARQRVPDEVLRFLTGDLRQSFLPGPRTRSQLTRIPFSSAGDQPDGVSPHMHLMEDGHYLQSTRSRNHTVSAKAANYALRI